MESSTSEVSLDMMVNDTNLMLNYSGSECPTYGDDGLHLIEVFNFWIEGVFKCIIAIAGLIANLVSAIILMKEDMRNSFNLLLVALICLDSCYLVGSVLESFRLSFLMASWIHVYLFPYFLYPALSIAVTGSVYMTVGIAIERYIAVHYPIDYSQAVNSPEACKRRLFKYVFPVIVISIIVNIPKFFESCIGTGLTMIHKLTNETRILNPGCNVDLEAVYSLDSEYLIIHEFTVPSVTDLRNDRNYVVFYSTWARLFIIGIIPTLLLIYFNYKIFQDVKNRNARQISLSRAVASTSQHARRKQEDNLAVVFMGIVLVFLVCHTPRNLLSFAEMVLMQEDIRCPDTGYQWPLWALLTYNISDVFLVINSSTNMVLYIFLNKAFRFHFMAMMKSILNCRKNCYSSSEETGLAMSNIQPSPHSEAIAIDEN